MGGARSRQVSVFQPLRGEDRSPTDESDHPSDDDCGEQDRQAQHGHPGVTTVRGGMTRGHQTVAVRHRVMNDADTVVVRGKRSLRETRHAVRAQPVHREHSSEQRYPQERARKPVRSDAQRRTESRHHDESKQTPAWPPPRARQPVGLPAMTWAITGIRSP